MVGSDLRPIVCLALLFAGCSFDTHGLHPFARDTSAERRDGPLPDKTSDRSDLPDQPAPDLAPSCSDGVQNGSESDVDCGGSCPEKCGDQKGCKEHVECTSGICGIATSTCAPCGGKPLDGFCWYRGAPAASCETTCAAHGGCDLAGTRDYAGSGGSDAQCMKVLELFQLEKIPHKSSSNNALGCQLCWPATPWTYWSAPPQGQVTTCTASGGGFAQCQLMCACKS